MSTGGEETLSDTWEKVLDAIGVLTNSIQSLPGCQDVVIRLCLCNGSHMDIYSFPESFPILGTVQISEQEGIGANPVPELNEGSTPDYSLPPTEDANNCRGTSSRNCSIDVLRFFNTRDFRLFFTSLRKKLGLNSFDWPQSARLQFAERCDDPIPSGPGRPNSGRASLLLMLQLSVDTDETWRKAVREQLDALAITKSTGTTTIEKMTTSEATEQKMKENGVHGIVHELVEAENEEWCEVVACKNRGEAYQMARNLPKDTLIVRIPRKKWVGLGELLESLRYPTTPCLSGWYIQKTPPDGNCLFSAILTAAKVRGVLPSGISSVASMRSLLKCKLEQLAKAGRKSSPFRREWLASCIYDLEGHFEVSVFTLLEQSLLTCSIQDIESFLAPLRMYVMNWSKKVGSKHWGGLLRVELSILGSITNCVIEVLDVSSDNIHNSSNSSTTLEMCDTRNGNRVVQATRRDLLLPIGSTVPSMNNRFLGPSETVCTDSGWLGPYPVLRVILHGKHYDACTSKFAYPIGGTARDFYNHSLPPCFSCRGILTEPYAALTKGEQDTWDRACSLITNWKNAIQVSDKYGEHADTVLFQCKSAVLSVSMLSRLQDVNERAGMLPTDFMLSDEIITCYMHLLERRNEVLITESVSKCLPKPPKCRYMDSWFYKALSRGLNGPSSRRQRSDLKDFSLIILPALVRSHWVLAVCYVNEGVIAVYDPFNTERRDVFEVVRRWAEVQLAPPSNSGWEFRALKESRNCEQVGCIDCGLYICKAAESIGLGLQFYMSQWDIAHVRRRMIVEFMKQEVTSILWPRK